MEMHEFRSNPDNQLPTFLRTESTNGTRFKRQGYGDSAGVNAGSGGAQCQGKLIKS